MKEAIFVYAIDDIFHKYETAKANSQCNRCFIKDFQKTSQFVYLYSLKILKHSSNSIEVSYAFVIYLNFSQLGYKLIKILPL